MIQFNNSYTLIILQCSDLTTLKKRIVLHCGKKSIAVIITFNSYYRNDAAGFDIRVGNGYQCLKFTANSSKTFLKV